MAAVFLDTNVFLYSVGADHPYRDSCRRILRHAVREPTIANTSTEVVQEILHVLRRKGRTEEAVRLARDTLKLFPAALTVTGPDLSAACDFIERYPGLPTRDAIHVAVMRVNGLDRIVTADRHFDGVEGIRRLDPSVPTAALGGSDSSRS